jgi:hypothetical protein
LKIPSPLPLLTRLFTFNQIVIVGQVLLQGGKIDAGPVRVSAYLKDKVFAEVFGIKVYLDVGLL